MGLGNNMKNKNVARHTLTHLFIIALGLLMIYPVIWMIVSSFKPNNLIFSDPGLIPKVVTIENYINGWKGYAGVSFGKFFINSFFMCTAAVVGNLIACTMAAYAFARLEFAGRKFWFAVMLITLMLPGHVTIVPRYILFNTFGWVGSYLPIIVPKFLATDAFFVFLLVQFIRSLPKELDEAAIIDGASQYQVFFQIMLPMAKSGLIAMGIFNFIGQWNQFLLPLVLMPNPDRYLLSQGLQFLAIQQGYGNDYSALFAALVITMVPTLIIYVLFQRRLESGLTAGALKG